MPIDVELKAAYPRFNGAARRWRHFCEQWRHCYVFLLGIFWVTWRLGTMAMPSLDNVRIISGLHPADVLFLMVALKMMWVPFVIAALLYVLSFLIPRLNTPGAVAVSALCSSSILALALMLALIRISL
jgi:hypothetical protein